MATPKIVLSKDKSFEEIQNEFCIDLDNILKYRKKDTYSKNKEKKYHPPFKCRLCGHTKYEGVYGDSIMIPLGGRRYPIAYRCSGCSVVFKDFVKFSVKE